MAKSGKVEMIFASSAAKLLDDYRKIAAAEAKQRKAVTDSAKATRRSRREFQTYAKRTTDAYIKIQSEAKRYQIELKRIEARYKAGKMTMATYRRAQKVAWHSSGMAAKEAGDKIKKAGDKTKNAFGPGAIRMMGTFTGMLGLGSIAGSITTIISSYDKWIEKTREVSNETKKAGNELIAFAALQEGGTKAKRAMAAAALGTQYGVSDRGEAFNTIQAMQSVYGSFEKGMKASKAIFAGSQLGIPVAMGREAEIYGAMQGAKPGAYIRRAYVAGEQSGRTPEAIVGGAEGIKFWDDKDLAFAAAAVMSGNIKEQKLGVYLKRGGISLSTVGGSQEFFEGIDMGKATRVERLAELSKRGIVSPEALTKIGIKEVRETEAVSALVKGYSEILRIQKVIKASAKPGLLARERAEVETELPTLGFERVSKMQLSRYRDELAFGKQAMPSMIEETKQRARGQVYTEKGLRSWGPLSFVDEEGRSTKWDKAFASVVDFGAGELGSQTGWGTYQRRPIKMPSRYLELEVQRQQYLDLMQARSGLGSDGASLTPVIEELSGILEKWSRWSEIQAEAMESIQRTKERINNPNPATNHGDHQ